VTAATKEAPQKPAFDEYVLVLEGEVHIMHGDGLKERTVAKAGQGFVLPANTRVQWVWPGPCKYVPICLPAFSPANCGREEATGPVAKTEDPGLPAMIEESFATAFAFAALALYA